MVRVTGKAYCRMVTQVASSTVISTTGGGKALEVWSASGPSPQRLQFRLLETNKLHRRQTRWLADTSQAAKGVMSDIEGRCTRATWFKTEPRVAQELWPQFRGQKKRWQSGVDAALGGDCVEEVEEADTWKGMEG